MSLAKQLREELDRMVNVQFETPEFIKFLSIKIHDAASALLGVGDGCVYAQSKRLLGVYDKFVGEKN